MADRRLRVLIVEDEMLVAMNIEDMLLGLGHEV
ncbi:MAG: response regulator, partial [Pseudomonadota bacterium]|nr:response regulator [Pseudomonadota bacterium]